VGGGNGFVAKGLIDAGWDVVLVEPGLSGARNAKKRGLEHVICGTTHSAGFKNGSLPAIGVFDVVEHIEDDLGFLHHLWDLLEPGGMLYLTVPAYNFLWSHLDENAGHFRRYTLGSMGKRFREAELKPIYQTYIFGYFPLAVLLLRTVPFRLGFAKKVDYGEKAKSDHSQKKGFLGSILERYFEFEVNQIRSKKTLEVGGSCLFVVKREC